MAAVTEGAGRVAEAMAASREGNRREGGSAVSRLEAEAVAAVTGRQGRSADAGPSRTADGRAETGRTHGANDGAQPDHRTCRNPQTCEDPAACEDREAGQGPQARRTPQA